MRWCSSRRAALADACLGRVALAAFVAVFASACNGGSEPTDDAALGSGSYDCEGRGEPIVLGMEKVSDGGLYKTSLTEASPLPPLLGENDWTVEVTTSSGEPVVDVTDVVDTNVIININMADHNHNSRKRATMVTPGVFEFPPLLITMPGYWEFTVVVAPEPEPSDAGADAGSADPNEHEDMLFGFCVAPE